MKLISGLKISLNMVQNIMTVSRELLYPKQGLCGTLKTNKYLGWIVGVELTYYCHHSHPGLSIQENPHVNDYSVVVMCSSCLGLTCGD